MAASLSVDFVYGIRSRYSYLASTQLDRIAAETGATINWIPIFGEELRPPDRDPFKGAPISGQYDWNYRKQDARAWAAFYRVPLREPVDRLEFEPRELVLAALAAGHGQARVAMMRRLFAAVFIEDRARIDRARSRGVRTRARRRCDRARARKNHARSQGARRVRSSVLPRRRQSVFRQRPAGAAGAPFEDAKRIFGVRCLRVTSAKRLPPPLRGRDGEGGVCLIRRA